MDGETSPRRQDLYWRSQTPRAGLTTAKIGNRHFFGSELLESIAASESPSRS